MCNFLKIECSGCDHDADNYNETRQGQAYIVCSTTPWNNPSKTYSSMQHHLLPPIFLSIVDTPLLTCYYQHSNMRRHSACTCKAQSSEYNALDQTLHHTILYGGKGFWHVKMNNYVGCKCWNIKIYSPKQLFCSFAKICPSNSTYYNYYGAFIFTVYITCASMAPKAHGLTISSGILHRYWKLQDRDKGILV